MKTRHQEDIIEYVEYRNTCEKKIKGIPIGVWKKNINDLFEDNKATKKLLYGLAKNYRKGCNETSYTVEDGNTVVEPEEITERRSEHFEEFLNITEETDYEEQEKQEAGQQQVETDGISMEKIEN